MTWLKNVFAQVGVAVFASSAIALDPTVKEISPGVFMPFVSMGGVARMPTNYSLWLEIGGRGLDTALTYGNATQAATGRAVRDSGLPRDQIFVVTKVPCCPSRSPGEIQDCQAFNISGPADTARAISEDMTLLGLEQVDLMLLHWPCSNDEATKATYRVLEGMLKDGQVLMHSRSCVLG